MKISRKKGGIYAKPILLLSIFKGIEDGSIVDNKICFDDNLINLYRQCFRKYDTESVITPPIYPYYYLRNDGFMTLSLNNNMESFRRTPSVAYLRENVKYASFDNALWDLLQDGEVRRYLQETIIKHFFKNNQ